MGLMAAENVAHTADSSEPGRKEASRTRGQDVLNVLPSLEMLPLTRKQVLGA